MFQVYAELNCDYGKKLNTTEHFKRSYLPVYINTQMQKRKKKSYGRATAYMKPCTQILQIKHKTIKVLSWH